MPRDKGSRPLILVVDDNATIRSLVSTILSGQDMVVATAGDGEEALAFLENQRPDLILLDLSMPRVDGLEVLQRIRGHPTLHNVQVVMLSAVANTPRFQEVHAYRPDGFLEKPFRINDLLSQVKRAIVHHDA